LRRKGTQILINHYLIFSFHTKRGATAVLEANLYFFCFFIDLIRPVLYKDEVSDSLNVEEIMENEVFAFPVSSGEPEVGLNAEINTSSTAHAQSYSEW
jgi:hypothetical protein